MHSLSTFQHARPILPATDKKRPDPIRWLGENSNNKYAVSNKVLPQLSVVGSYGRPQAALISLVRNSELEGMMQSMRQLEYRWNRKYQVRVNIRDKDNKLMCCSILGYSSMTSHSRKNSKQLHRIRPPRNATMRLSHASIGRCQNGLTRADL